MVNLKSDQRNSPTLLKQKDYFSIYFVFQHLFCILIAAYASLLCNYILDGKMFYFLI